ncbi:MAG TPA: hypothetical protein VH988_18875 [Thermoanaerobaculia bacterium]|jgi:hypothetical protein|nr:hypothetical protein [Thermoanaerobaculia bacterium]
MAKGFVPVQKKVQPADGQGASPFLKVRPFPEARARVEGGEQRDLLAEYVQRRAVTAAPEAGGALGFGGHGTVQLARGKKSKHDRKNRRLAKASGLHLSELASPTPKNIEAEIGLRYPEENDLVRAAEQLSGDFVWTSPGGTLFYDTLFKHWGQYAPWLRSRVKRKNRAQFDLLSTKIANLDREADEGAYAPLLKGVRALLEGLEENEVGDESFLDLGDQFKSWLDEGVKPTHLNCWEAVIFACVEAGKLDRGEIRDYVEEATNKSSEAVFRKFILGRSMEVVIENGEEIPEHSPIENAEAGAILCFWKDDSIDHVAIYLGNGRCKSIWVEDTMRFATTTYARLAALYDEVHLEIINF